MGGRRGRHREEGAPPFLLFWVALSFSRVALGLGHGGQAEAGSLRGTEEETYGDGWDLATQSSVKVWARSEMWLDQKPTTWV